MQSAGKRRVALGLLIATVFISSASFAGTATEVQKLNFGLWYIVNDSSSHFITVATDGDVSSSPGDTIMVKAPQPGIYNITDLDPFTVIGSVDVTMIQPLHGSGPAGFTMEDFTTDIADADGSGTTVLTLGATARTSGTNQSYGEDTYNGQLHIEINY